MLVILLLPLLFVASAAAKSCAIETGAYSLTGKATVEGACRYTLRYAYTAERWGYSWVASDIFNETTTDLPPSCPQSASTPVVNSVQSEDCLFATVYAPQSFNASAKVPVFVWIHGGSYLAGSASAAGLDGSTLATKGNMVVVVLQYRLGVLGLLPPSSAPSSGDPNLGILDVINGLKAVNYFVSYFGGNTVNIVVGGQSSGAGIIRALWGAPEAQGLFHAAILQSDPMDYGLASSSLTSQLQAEYYAMEPMASCSDLKCLQDIPFSTIVETQTQFTASAPFTVTGDAFAEPIRPTIGTTTLPVDSIVELHSCPNSLSVAPSDLPILITTVKNEAGSVVQSLLPQRVTSSNTTYFGILSEFVGTDRAEKIINAPFYALTSPASPDDLRETFDRLVTDGIWRCANRDVARQWAGAGGKVFVGEWRQGVQYATNAGSYCNQSGVVCHQDDIYPVFHTAPNPNSNTTALEDQVLSYWISFITTRDPNPTTTKRSPAHNHPHRPRRVADWKPYTSESTTGEVFSIGGDGQVSPCPEGFWGETVQFDWQIYG